MFAYILRRFAEGMVVLLVVSMLCFLLFRFLGDPVLAIVGYQHANQQIVDEARVRLGLDQPIPVQYLRFLSKALRGDFGISYTYNRPVIQVIAERIPATLEMVVLATVISSILGLLLGIMIAAKPKTLLSRGILLSSLFGISMPSFLVAILLILLFAVVLRWLPASGRGATSNLGLWTTGILNIDGLKHLVLPVLTLVLYPLAMIVRLVRAEMLDVLSQDYVRTALAKGLTMWRVLWAHSLRNAIIPVLTIVGLQFSESMAFSIVTETVFQWPGLGRLLILAIFTSDAPVVVVYIMLVALLILFINLLVDLSYAILDPRIRYS